MWSLGAALDKCLKTLDSVQLALPPLPPTPSGEPGLDEKMARALVGVQIVRDALGEPDRSFDQSMLHEILTGSSADGPEGAADGDETEPTSPSFTPIVSPSPIHQSPFIPPQPPSPSASPPPDLPSASGNGGGGRTVFGGEGVALPTLAHGAQRPSPPLGPVPSKPASTPILSLPPAAPPRLGPPPLPRASAPQPQSLAARLAQAAQKPASRPPSTGPSPSPTPSPTTAKPPPWIRASNEPAPPRSSGSYPPLAPTGDPLAGAASTARSDHWRSLSSSAKKPAAGGDDGALAGGDPLGAL